MEYTALYRKYRPRTFAALVGQQHIAKTLQNALRQQRVSHAYLFCGPRGTGKTSVAHIMSRAVNCLNPQQGEPCGECEACRRIIEGRSMDITELDAASKRGIDEMRDLLDRVKYTPVNEKYKVYIIDEVHMLTNEAFNALLKTLEEPPEHIIFILATTEPHKVPVTVLSRCQRFDFHRVADADIAQHLAYVVEQEQAAADADALALIARRAQGGMRDALGLLDQCLVFADGRITAATVAQVLGTASQELVAECAAAVAGGRVPDILQTVEQLCVAGFDLRQFLQQLLEYLRDQILLSVSGGPVVIEPRRALLMLRDLVDADMRMRTAALPRITLEVSLLNAARLVSAPAQENTAPVKTEAAAPQQSVAAAAAVSSGAARSVSGGAALDEVAARWPEVLKLVRKKSAVTSAFLQMGKPIAVNGTIITVGFGEKYAAIHMVKVTEDEHKALIDAALREVYGEQASFVTAVAPGL